MPQRKLVRLSGVSYDTLFHFAERKPSARTLLRLVRAFALVDAAGGDIDAALERAAAQAQAQRRMDAFGRVGADSPERVDSAMVAQRIRAERFGNAEFVAATGYNADARRAILNGLSVSQERLSAVLRALDARKGVRVVSVGARAVSA